MNQPPPQADPSTATGPDGSSVDPFAAAGAFMDAPQFQRHRAVKPVGHGALGTVWLCTDRHGNPVAIKIPHEHQASAELLRLFERECRTLRSLPPHRNVVAPADDRDELAVMPSGRRLPGLVMEYLRDAQPLDSYVQSAKCTKKERVRLFLEACEGLMHLHRNNQLHLDFKPGNVLSVKSTDSRANGGRRIVISDLGSAKHALAWDPTDTPRTIEYAAPEQSRRESIDSLTEQADVYSAGKTLAALVEPTALRGPPDQSATARQEAARGWRAERLRRQLPLPDPHLVRTVRDATRVRCEDRTRTIAELVEAVRRWRVPLAQRVTLRTMRTWDALPPSARIVAAVIAIAALGLMASMLATWISNRVGRWGIAPPVAVPGATPLATSGGVLGIHVSDDPTGGADLGELDDRFAGLARPSADYNRLCFELVLRRLTTLGCTEMVLINTQLRQSGPFDDRLASAIARLDHAGATVALAIDRWSFDDLTTGPGGPLYAASSAWGCFQEITFPGRAGRRTPALAIAVERDGACMVGLAAAGFLSPRSARTDPPDHVAIVADSEGDAVAIRSSRGMRRIPVGVIDVTPDILAGMQPETFGLEAGDRIAFYRFEPPSAAVLGAHTVTAAQFLLMPDVAARELLSSHPWVVLATTASGADSRRPGVPTGLGMHYYVGGMPFLRRMVDTATKDTSLFLTAFLAGTIGVGAGARLMAALWSRRLRRAPSANDRYNPLRPFTTGTTPPVPWLVRSTCVALGITAVALATFYVGLKFAVSTAPFAVILIVTVVVLAAAAGIVAHAVLGVARRWVHLVRVANLVEDR